MDPLILFHAHISDLLISIGLTITAVASLLAAYVSWLAKKEVTTLNDMTAAQYQDAEETRRILKKLKNGEDLTAAEQIHIDEIDIRGRAK